VRTDIDPADGYVGLMTWDQFNRLERAVNNAIKHVPWWRVCGNIRNTASEELERVSSSSSYPLPLPAPWLAAEEIKRLLEQLNQWPELSDAANDDDGVYFAELLIREVETAMARWPISDRSHKVRYINCFSCDMETLRYFPPTIVGDQLLDTTVRCTNRACGVVMDETLWGRAVALIEAENERKAARGRSR